MSFCGCISPATLGELNLAGRYRRARNAKTELGDTDKHDRYTQNDAEAHCTEAYPGHHLPAGSGKTIHGSGKKFRMHPIENRSRNRLRHHNRLLSQ